MRSESSRPENNVDADQLALFDGGSEQIWSYSKLKTLRRCPLEYKVRWVDHHQGLFQPSYIDVQAGRLLHRVVREFYRSKKGPTPNQTVWNIYEQYAPKTTNWVEDLRGEIRVFSALRLFSHSSAATYRAVDLDVSCKGYVGGQLFCGQADVIYESGEQPNSLGILEFKLNDVEISSEDIEEKFLQCIIYYIGLPKELKYRCNRASIYVFDTGEQIEVTIDAGMVERANNIILSALPLANGPDFPPRLNSYCASCGYQNQCPAYNKR